MQGCDWAMKKEAALAASGSLVMEGIGRGVEI